MTTLTSKLCFRVVLLGTLLNYSVALSAAEVTFHQGVELLEFKPPGRVAPLRDGTFGAIAKDRFYKSDRQGQNWQLTSEIERGKGPAVQGGILVETQQGALVYLYNDMENYHLERTENNMPLPGANLDIWTVRSADGGKNWLAPQKLLDGYCGAMISAVCLRNNRVVVPLQDLRYEPPRHVTVVYCSDDNGATWSMSEDLDIGGYGLEDGGFEGAVTQLKDESLLMYLRTSRDRLWWTKSEDGLQWTLPTSTDLKASNSPAYLLQLQSGKLALVWNQLYPEGATEWPRREKTRYAERPDNVYREELSLAFSSDAGQIWSAPTVIAREPGGRLRYAYMFERSPGEIWLQVKGRWLKILENDFAKP